MRKKSICCIGLLLALLIIVPLPSTTAQAAESVYENQAVISFSSSGESKTYVVERTGSYRIYVYGKGGNGGSAKYAYAHTGVDSFGPSGSGGGSGGVVIHDVTLTAGDKVNISYDNDTVTVTDVGATLVATAGKNGSAALYYETSDGIFCTAASGGIGGSGSGGNVANVQGATGEPGTGYNPKIKNNGSTGFNDKKYGGAGGHTSTKYGGVGKYGSGGAGGDCVVTPTANQAGTEIGNGQSGYVPVVYFDIAQDTTPPMINSAPTSLEISSFATTSAENTLADYATGTVFKIKEDGAYQNWILVDHNYRATGNQLLMRQNTISYADGLSIGSIAQSTYGKISIFYDSPLEDYLNNGFFYKFTEAVRSNIKTVSVPVIYATSSTSVSQTTENYKVFILSLYEISGTTGDTTNGTAYTGSYISYFSTLANRKANTEYALRDAKGYRSTLIPFVSTIQEDDGYTEVSNYIGTGSLRSNFRPCIVLPADTVIDTDNQINGIITPATPTVSVSGAWATSNTATLTATNATHYAVTTTNTAPGTGWQTSNVFSLTSNGTYYAWARSATNTVSSSKSFTVSKVDKTGPEISAITVSDTWATTNTATISASDAGVGTVSHYAVTSTNVVPSSGWQAGNTFSLSANGTWYAWARDSLGNVSATKSFTVSRVDAIAPVISEVVLPTNWTASATAIVVASDTGSDIAGYTLTQSSTVPSGGWQTSPELTISSNGMYYVWAKDNAGNTAYKNFYFSKIDADGPVISGVSVSNSWALSNTAVINASDAASGVTAYSTNTSSGSPPSGGWQSSNIIEITANGTYFAWSRDAVGNVSEPYEFTISKVDNTAPIITSVNVPSNWGKTNIVTLNALDIGSGISAYAVTTDSSSPPSEGWESSRNFDITDNGTYFAWTRDSVGNVSVAYEFTVTKVDTTIPVISSVTVPSTWATSSTIMVNASDAGSGVAAYAVTTNGNSPTPEKWQSEDTIKLAANGTYFAWARDSVGNISEAYEFTVTKVDTIAPVIGSVTVPDGWGLSNTITVNSSDTGSGIASYAVTTSYVSAPVDGWQTDASFTLSSNGTYFAWTKDRVGNVSDAYEFTITKVDTTAPVIGSVTVPSAWATSSKATITATDIGSGVSDYAMSTDGSTPPADGWQSGKSIDIVANGTYFAWVRDNVGNVSDAYEFTVTNVDNIDPIVTSVHVPDSWDTSSSIKINALDIGSGLAAYSVTTDSISPTEGWQSSERFNLTSNGVYFAWTRDAVGNISAAYEFTVTKVDTTAPVIGSVAVPDEWAVNSSATINASDIGSGVTAYAVTADNSEPSPSQWQSNNIISIAANGTYYAWAQDAVGNISEAYEFTVMKVDTTAPVINTVIIPDNWGLSSTVTVDGSDAGSGVAAYAVTTGGTLAPVVGWQSDARFTFSSNGTFFAWTKDQAGNISVAYEFIVTKVDIVAPVISAAIVPDIWATSSAVTITAADTGSGVAGYAVTTDNSTPPVQGWQIENIVDIAENGIYFAWTRDNVGNISAAYEFAVTKIDTAAPEIISVDVPDEWGTSSAVAVSASDIGSGIAAYAISTNGSAPPADGWQDVSTFTVEENGSQFAFVKDFVGNVSVQPFNVTKIDTMPPVIVAISFNENYSLLNVVASDDLSGVDTIFVNMTEYAGNSAEYPITEGLRYATIFAVDSASNQSDVIVQRVPGWFDILDTITIDSVETLDEETVKITASSTGDPIAGIWVNQQYFGNNPLTYTVPEGIKTLEMQAQDINGDRSEIYTHYITGREEEIPSLTVMAVDFSPNYLMARITATEIGEETSFKGIKGIQVNNDFLEGNPVDYEIPEGTKRIAARAINNEGDFSKEVVKRVPGWSEIINTLQIDTVTFNASNTEATVTAISEGATVSGIYVNGVLSSGNPIVYSIAPGTTELVLQAVNTEGDRSEIVTVAVPRNSGGGGSDGDSDYSYRSLPHITILPPAWTNAQSVEVEIQATDKYGIREINAQTLDQPVWRKITQNSKITISQDTTVFAYAINNDGAKSETHLDITCFDRQPPTVTATQQGYMLKVSAKDDKSGVSAIVIDGKAHSGSEIFSGSYSYSIPAGVTTVTVQALDNAGNISGQVKIAIKSPAVIVPGVVEEKPVEPTPPAPQPESPPRTEVEIPSEPDVVTASEDSVNAAGFIKMLALVPALILLAVLILIWRRRRDRDSDADAEKDDITASEFLSGNIGEIATPTVENDGKSEDAKLDADAEDNHVVVNFGNSIVESKFRKLGGK